MKYLARQALAAYVLFAVAAGVPAPALAASSSTAVANAPPAATARIERTGTFVLDLNLAVSPDLPDGSVVTIYATASTFDADYSDSFELFGAQAKVADHKVSGTFDMPYTWLVATTDRGQGHRLGLGERHRDERRAVLQRRQLLRRDDSAARKRRKDSDPRRRIALSRAVHRKRLRRRGLRQAG
jgi:hypothetical protein